MLIKLSDHFTYKRLLKFVVSPIIMMIFTSIYSVVDGFFISNFGGIYGFTAVNLVFPVLMICSAIGFMIGSGGSALVSKTMGENKNQLANQYFSMLAGIVVVVGVCLAILGCVFIKQISIWLGAEGEVLPEAITYGRIMFLSLPAFMLQNFFQSFFITAEKPQLGLYIIIGAGVTNILLDATFVALLGLGIKGAAIATAISQTIGGVLPLIYFFSKNSSALRFVKTKLYVKEFLVSLLNGSSEFLTNVSLSIVSIVYNFKLLKLLGNNGVSAYGFVMYVSFIFIAVFIGYSMGVASPVGYHFGAKNKIELKNLFTKSIKIIGIISVTMFILAQVFAVPVSKLFVGYDKELLNLSINAFKKYSIGFLFVGINIFGSAFFTALNNGVVSGVLSILRTLVFSLASVLLLPIWLNVTGIWYSNAVAEFVSLIVTVITFISLSKKYGY